MSEIELGDKVRCKYSGFTGIAVTRVEFINGCVQYGIVPKVTKDKQYPEEVGIDEGSLELVSPKKKKRVVKDTGGPVTRNIRQRGY